MLIPLGGRRGPLRGHAIIDDVDAPLVDGRAWYLDSGGYAQSETKERVRLHRLLMQPPLGFEVDHIDGNKLDCRRANMRIVTHAQNAQNVRTAKGSMRGVYLDARDGKWYGQVKHRGIRYGTGRFATPKEAQAAVVSLRRSLLVFAA